MFYLPCADPKRRNPCKNLIKINSLRQAWESELCTDDYGQPYSAPKLLRYVACTNSYLACRLVPNIEEAQANPANKALPAVDIRDVLDCDAPDMSRINLRNLLPTCCKEGTSENVPSSSQPAQRKRGRTESSAGPSCLATAAQPSPFAPEALRADQHFTHLGNIVCSGMVLRSGAQTHGEGSTPLWAPRMEYKGGDAVIEADCILPVGDGRSALVVSALSQAVRLLLDIEEWKKATDDELINNLRRGLLMVSQSKNFSFCKFLQLLFCLTTLPSCRGSKLHWS